MNPLIDPTGKYVPPLWRAVTLHVELDDRDEEGQLIWPLTKVTYKRVLLVPEEASQGGGDK